MLGISGWFLSAAGLASAMGTALVFNFFTPGALVRLMAILRTAGRYGEQVFSHDHLLGLLRSLRLWVWDQRINTPQAKVNKQTKGDLLQRLVGDLDQIIKWPLAVIMPWVYGLVACLGLFALGAFVSPTLMLPITLYSVVQLWMIPWLANRAALLSVYRMQALSVHRRSRFMSVFSALITLTIRGHWQHYSERLDNLDERQRKLQACLQRSTSKTKLISQLMSFLLIGSFFILCLEITDQGISIQAEVEATWLVALVLAALGVNELMQPISNAVLAQGQSKVGLKRLNQLAISAPLEREDDAPRLAPFQNITLRGFTGRYETSPTSAHLPKVNISISCGGAMRLVGASGSGKSTCLAALAGDINYDGEVLLDDQRFIQLDSPSWRSQLAFLSQQSVIFQQSLRANLCLGNAAASDTELYKVLHTLGLKEWAEALPNGLDTLLGAQGRDISGGQARRICLARVLLRSSPVLILDEPFDGLDSSSIERICGALLEGPYKPDFLIYASHVDTALDRCSHTVML
ncbi:ATP-binding cassette domain-containing protein [Marinomonas ostreistagni]|uniref:ATP-binding cassette domain-containing protein n=1 Tax=Marinomonas ostreistagni TaxID=359209 RepID=A0ABS0ZAN8_9GAMM|nr:ATP-binding cassette domain-containing protein [Marinomonas ostreistagni]